jgi:hypothetical protein
MHLNDGGDASWNGSIHGDEEYPEFLMDGYALVLDEDRSAWQVSVYQ